MEDYYKDYLKIWAIGLIILCIIGALFNGN